MYTRIVTLLFIIALIFPAYHHISWSTASGDNSVEQATVWAETCFRDVLVEPIYIVNSSYSNVFPVSGPINLTIPLTYTAPNGSLMRIRLVLRLEPTRTGNVSIAGVREEKKGSVRVEEFSVRVPYGSIGVAPIDMGLVARNLTIAIRHINSSYYRIVVSLNGILFTDASVAGIGYFDLYGLAASLYDRRVHSLNLSSVFLYDAVKDKSYLYDNGKLVLVGEKLPFFIYPEAFNPRVVAGEIYSNIIAWLHYIAKNNEALKLLAEKVRRAKTRSEAVKLVIDFAEKAIEESIMPRYSYLGRNYRFSGLDYNNTPTWSAPGVVRIVEPKGLLKISVKLLRGLLEAGEPLEKALLKSMRITGEPRTVDVVNGSIIAAYGSNITLMGGVIIPLPHGNPLRANALLVEIPAKKMYPCDPRKAIEKVLGQSLEGYEIRSINGTSFEVVDKKTGEVVFHLDLGEDWNGTDKIVIVAEDRDSARLQDNGFREWMLLGKLVKAYLLDAGNLVIGVVDDAARHGGVVDEAKAYAGLEKLREKYSILFSRGLASTTTTPALGEGRATSTNSVNRGYAYFALEAALVASLILAIVAYFVVAARRARR